MDKPVVRLFITGGSIDDIDYEKEDDAPIDKASYIPVLLRKSRVRLPYEYEILIQKDSRFITDQDRQLILDKCRECEEDKIIITHGSYTMAQTAKLLGPQHLPKTIVLFGSIIPVNKPESDALFNLGGAFMAVQTLPNGVYIVSNGKVFNWDNVQKDLRTAFFEEERKI